MLYQARPELHSLSSKYSQQGRQAQNTQPITDRHKADRREPSAWDAVVAPRALQEGKGTKAGQNKTSAVTHRALVIASGRATAPSSRTLPIASAATRQRVEIAFIESLYRIWLYPFIIGSDWLLTMVDGR